MGDAMWSNSQIRTDQYLSFNLGESLFAVEVRQTKEILDYRRTTRVPQTPDYMLGVINLRGAVVPVIDLRRKLGLPARDVSQDTCIVVLEIARDEEVLTVGVVTDSVQEVLELSADEIEPPPRIGSGLNIDYIRGMGKKEDNFIILLDANRIFSSDEIVLLQGDLDPAVLCA
jgi:purine-binding chemotaxis protein CheW